MSVAPSVDAEPRASPYALTRWDKIAGIALPLVAADAQAWLMPEDVIGPWLIWGYAAFGIVALLGSAKVWTRAFINNIVCGANFGCAAGWLFAAIDHTLFSYFFVWPFALGTLVLLPLASLNINRRRAFMLLQQSRRPSTILIATAALCVFAIPIAIQVVEARWITGILQELSQHKLPNTIAALQAVNRYPLRFGRFASDVCDYVVIGGDWNADEAVKHEVIKILGANPENCESRDPHG